MAALQNGVANGINGHHTTDSLTRPRFSDIPPQIDIPVAGESADEAVEISLVELLDDPTELCTLLESESVGKQYWMVIALAYAKQRKVDHAIEMVTKGLASLREKGGTRGTEERLSLLGALCWLYLWKCRDAPRVKPEGQLASEARTKDFYLQLATSTLNDASRISPSYAPLHLARGVLYLLRASQPSRTGQDAERIDMLRQASASFDSAIRADHRNMMAVMGKARAQFSLGRYADALQGYQMVLEQAPHVTDPDPRIGIGCCFWQLTFKDDAKGAWQRALEVNPESKIANVLMGLYYLDQSSKYPLNDPHFAQIYKTAMTKYTQKAFKLDERLPLACAVFGGYFLMRRAWAQVERLARRAIELTDVNAIASDGWYLLARKEHYEGDVVKAHEYYSRADLARGGENKGYLPAKFGMAQIQALQGNYADAKFRLEGLAQAKNVEAMTLLGTLYAEEVFTAQASGLREDKSTELKKAISYLEGVRISWKDPKKKITPDSAVLLNLARLYEHDQPDKSLQCLQQVEQMELAEVAQEDKNFVEDIVNERLPLDDYDLAELDEKDQKDETKKKASKELKAAKEKERTEREAKRDAERLMLLREYLPPQLLNNIACFHYSADRITPSRELFQSALNACVKINRGGSGEDVNNLITSISYNLGRAYEAENDLPKAEPVYEGVMQRPGSQDYADARVRLAYIALNASPHDEGPKAIQALYQTEPDNLEVRALYGWYLRGAKKRTHNVAEDAEQRHYKHTLQNHDKHDRYSLTGMGNIYLATARDMRRETDSEKERRSKQYAKAVEFFDKALQLDPRNAYAAQGIGIAVAEDKKDFGAALSIFSKVRETVRTEPNVYTNLGHVYGEVRQYARAIENYEAALTKGGAKDPALLCCLGRVWFLRGKHEKSVQAMKTSLEYSQRALEARPDEIYLRFNIAFVQIQLAQLIYSLPDSQRSLGEVEAAQDGLNDAIDAFTAIAKSPHPPFPPHDLEQRANMGRNTMRKQLDRAIQNQREYEDRNAERLRLARETREAEMRAREEEVRRREEVAAEQRRKIAEERRRMEERDRELAERRMEEERKREEAEMTTDSETGERRKRVKRKGGKRKKKGTEDESDLEEEESGRGRRARSEVSAATPASSDLDGGEQPRKEKPRKKRRLERKQKSGKAYKSTELVEDSDDNDDAGVTMNGNRDEAEKREDSVPMDEAKEGGDLFGEDEDGVAVPRKKSARVVDEEDDDDDELGGSAAKGAGETEDIPMGDVEDPTAEDEE
ncbi:TPR-like protein [Viridothelium virens]|uniref:TPR-like protein n=1 Tax=Viridothelium virens TaxID=1048519 RepID=A0A6A6H280_VIRVR|nr:TPR-like protein [Viridothelium virens]